jgi:diacylglycerol O-acyltransferase/trehalose O-mycolyltransferase
MSVLRRCVVLWSLALLILVPCARAHDRPVRADDGATVVAQQRVAPNLVDLTISSPALGRTGKVRLITPRGWDRRRGHERWPVLFLLHGCCDTYDSWTRETDVETLPALRDVLVVTPEAGAVGFYSDWYNGGAGGPPRWETFHLLEVRQLLERGYGAGSRRVVAGLSMGGFGALSYAARHRSLFRAAASYSGVVNPLRDAASILGIVGSFTPDPLALWGDPQAQRAIWEAHDPTVLAPRLRGLPLFVSVGTGQPGPLDPPGATQDPIETMLHGENLALAQRLRELHIRAQLDFYGPGTHTWPYWERELHRSLPLLLRAL